MESDGLVGVLLTGVFAVQRYGGTPGLIEGNWGQLTSQLIGILLVCLYTACATFMILNVVDWFVGLKIDSISEAREEVTGTYDQAPGTR